MKVAYLITHVVLLVSLSSGWVWAQEDTAAEDSDATAEASYLDEDGEPMTEKEISAIETNATSDEDPDVLRRAQRQSEVQPEEKVFKWSFYGSGRVHLINPIDPATGEVQSTELGDGASRIGLTGEWYFTEGWNLFGRVESGFDILETFTPKAQNDNGGALTPRLYNIGIESDALYAKYGKSWSTYYQVAGAADRFSIFGGNAVGVYNAGTDGGATGTGRADEALQTHFLVDLNSLWNIKPFELNVQYQRDQPIPQADGERYSTTWSFSTWLENDSNVGVGLAWHNAGIEDPMKPALQAVGIDGNANAFAVALKTYGDRWLVGLVWAALDNIETTDQGRYVNGSGAELFGQWEFSKNWWLIGGGNWFTPDEDDPDAGEFEISYTVIGMRYTFESFKRMLYAEWKMNGGTLADGTSVQNEVTLGVRWDFGYP